MSKVRRIERELIVAVVHVVMIAVLFGLNFWYDDWMARLLLHGITCFLAFVAGKKICHHVKFEDLLDIQCDVTLIVAAASLLDVLIECHCVIATGVSIMYLTIFATIRIMLLKKNS